MSIVREKSYPSVRSFFHKYLTKTRVIFFEKILDPYIEGILFKHLLYPLLLCYSLRKILLASVQERRM